MFLSFWSIALIVIGVLLAVFARGVPRVLAVVATAVSLLSYGLNIYLVHYLRETVSLQVLSFLVAALSVVTQVVVLGLFVTAAAIASRARLVTQTRNEVQ